MVKIIAHFMEKGNSAQAAISSNIPVIENIIGKAPAFFRSGGPVKAFTIGQSSNGRQGLSSRAAGIYSHYDAVIGLYETDGARADDRVDAVETGLIQKFKEDPRCENSKLGGSRKSEKVTSRNVYLAVLAHEDRRDELSEALAPDFD